MNECVPRHTIRLHPSCVISNQIEKQKKKSDLGQDGSYFLNILNTRHLSPDTQSLRSNGKRGVWKTRLDPLHSLILPHIVVWSAPSALVLGLCSRKITRVRENGESIGYCVGRFEHEDVRRGWLLSWVVDRGRKTGLATRSPGPSQSTSADGWGRSNGGFSATRQRAKAVVWHCLA